MAMFLKTVEVIEVSWEGPISLRQVVATRKKAEDYGVCQIYGTHNVFGPQALLYIGMARHRRHVP